MFRIVIKIVIIVFLHIFISLTNIYAGNNFMSRYFSSHRYDLIKISSEISLRSTEYQFHDNFYLEGSMLSIPAQLSRIESCATSKTRKYYVYTGIGVLELFVFGLGKHIDENWSLSSKINVTILSGGWGNGAYGVGVKVSRYLLKESTFFNVINVEPVYLFKIEPNYTPFRGFSFEANIGGENIGSEQVNYIWSIGLIVSTGTDAPPLYMLSVKVGWGWNF